MKIILFGVLGATLLTSLFLFYKEYVRRQTLKLISKKYAAIRPLVRQLKNGDDITSDDILTMCKDPSLRIGVFGLLKLYNRSHLFPEPYLTREKGAESYLVMWLEFPTELGATPDHIEFLVKVIIQEFEALEYYVFKFMMKSSHPKSRESMLGACGPYTERSMPYDMPHRIYSRFKTLETATPESEARWIHTNINKGL